MTIDRAEATGFGVAVTGHALLLAALAFGLVKFASAPIPTDAIEVSFVDDIAAVSTAPQPSAEPPAPAMAPDLGPIEDAMPSATPAPTPPVPEPRPTPPPDLTANPRQRPEPPRQRPQRDLPRPTQAQPKQTAPSQSGRGQRTQRSQIGDVLKGIGRDPSPSRNQNPPAAAMSQRAAADIASAIVRQVQPCADRQIYPGPGAERIVTTLNLQLNRDGSLAARPRMTRQSGIDLENQRYAERVRDLAIAAFVGCAPLRGLPAELYEVPRGWRNFTLNYRLPK